jgi:hypothetical protein
LLRSRVGVKMADLFAGEGSWKHARTRIVARGRKFCTLATSEGRRIDGLQRCGRIVEFFCACAAREIWRMGSERRWLWRSREFMLMLRETMCDGGRPMGERVCLVDLSSQE